MGPPARMDACARRHRRARGRPSLEGVSHIAKILLVAVLFHCPRLFVLNCWATEDWLSAATGKNFRAKPSIG